MFGFLNVYKPKGKTSHDVVACLRRITKIKQIGHTGTLDPFAEGVLPICIGKATRLIEYLNDDKAYTGVIQFGNSTTTYDIEGEMVEKSDKKTEYEDLKKVISNFQGEIEQLPPVYSAIKVKGKKLYEYARKGEEVEIKPRKVCISEIKINNFDYDSQTAELFISCSKGTYIRSVANDIGKSTGSYGYLKSLIRVKAGKFLVEDSVKLEDLDTVEKVKAHLIYPLEYLDYPKYEISEYEKEKISHGNSIDIENYKDTVILTYEGNLCAVGNVTENVFKCSKVFV